MTPALWIGLALWIAGILVQIGIGRFTQRLDRVEKAVDAINKSRSDEENKMQAWIGDVDVRMALLEQSHGIKPRKGSAWSRS